MDNVVQVGDIVELNVDKENREWGYDPGKDGTKVEIVRFSENASGRFNCYNGTRPGIYVNRCYADVKFPNGEIKTISTLHLKSNKNFDRFGIPQFIRDLPETPFYEWDSVKPTGKRDLDANFARTINYIHYGDTITYDVGPGYKAGGSYSMLREDDIELVERGPIWKFFHNKPLDLEGDELFYLYYKLGLYHEVRNPNNGLFRWSMSEMFKAAQSDIIDISTSMFSDVNNSAIRFINRQIGERARKYYIRNVDSKYNTFDK